MSKRTTPKDVPSGGKTLREQAVASSSSSSSSSSSAGEGKGDKATLTKQQQGSKRKKKVLKMALQSARYDVLQDPQAVMDTQASQKVLELLQGDSKLAALGERKRSNKRKQSNVYHARRRAKRGRPDTHAPQDSKRQRIDNSTTQGALAGVAVGINAVTRRLEKDKAALVVLATRVYPRVMVQHIAPLAHRHNVKMLLLDVDSAQLGAALGLRSAAVVAFASGDDAVPVIEQLQPLGKLVDAFTDQRLRPRSVAPVGKATAENDA